jgi:hypothetical protein
METRKLGVSYMATFSGSARTPTFTAAGAAAKAPEWLENPQRSGLSAGR